MNRNELREQIAEIIIKGLVESRRKDIGETVDKILDLMDKEKTDDAEQPKD